MAVVRAGVRLRVRLGVRGRDRDRGEGTCKDGGGEVGRTAKAAAITRWSHFHGCPGQQGMSWPRLTAVLQATPQNKALDLPRPLGQHRHATVPS